MVHFDLVSNPWLEKNIIKDHGPLGALYPKVRFIMEGDTTSYLGLVNNGLGWHTSQSYGGWGGRYVIDQPPGEPRPILTNNNKESRDTGRNSQRQDRDVRFRNNLALARALYTTSPRA
jgi:hypothetical protein